MILRIRTASAVINRTTTISAAVIVVILVAAAVWWFGFASKAQAGSTTSTTQSLTVATRTLQETVSGTGTLAPTVDEDVSFAASGIVTAVKVTAGQTVTKGQVLATVTTTQADADLAQANATLASAQAQLSDARTSSTGSAVDIAAIAADVTAVSVASTSVTAAQAEVDGTSLVAPVAGILAAVDIAVGDQVTAASTSSTGTSGTGASASAGGSSDTGSAASSTSTASSSAAFEITGTDSWTTSISVSAAAVKNIKTGDQVTLATTENSSFFGTVAAIGLLPSTTTGAATYPVTVDVTGKPDNLYDGVSVTAGVIYKQIADAVAVQSLAITTTGGKSTVQKLVNGKAVTTTVTTGIEEGGYTQIVKGLSSGDTIQVRTARPGAGTGSTKTGGTSETGTTGTTGGPGFGSTTGGTGFSGPGQQGGN